MDRRLIATAALVAALGVGIRSASAEKFVKQVNGKEFVVHTRITPVVVHRIFPPYLGKHVSQRQLHKGRLPPGAR